MLRPRRDRRTRLNPPRKPITAEQEAMLTKGEGLACRARIIEAGVASVLGTDHNGPADVEACVFMLGKAVALRRRGYQLRREAFTEPKK